MMNDVPVFFTNANTLHLHGSDFKAYSTKKKIGKSKKKAIDEIPSPRSHQPSIRRIKERYICRESDGESFEGGEIDNQ